VSPAEASRLAGIGRTTIYQAISSGDLKSLKIRARRLVAVEALREWLLKHEVKR
jgi:excisionase family DNA binding protein